MNNPETPLEASEPKPNGKSRNRVGLVLIILSGVFWFSIFAVPFTPLSVTRKSVLAGILFALVQVSWWTGAALVGPTAIAAAKNRLFRK